jgi:DNA-binding LacI/PurR family transcriptional regulator
MAATIKDIAKRLNISVSTVSYALNGGPRPVPEDVRQRVLQAAADLSYRPNRLARSLVTRRTFTVGVVPTEPTIHLAITPYFQGVLNGVMNEAEKYAQDVLILTRYTVHRADEMVNSLVDGRVDGAVFISPFANDPLFTALQEREFPFVVTSAFVDGAPSYIADNGTGVYRAVRHLYDLGHRRIAHVTGRPVMEEGRGRRDHFVGITSELGIYDPELVVEGNFCHERGVEAAQELLTRGASRPTAVFCANDDSAVGFIEGAWRLGLRVPDDVSVVGFDDAPISTIMRPALTTVRQPFDRIGAGAMRGLLDLIEGRGTPAHEQFSTELVVRASTASPLEDK